MTLTQIAKMAAIVAVILGCVTAAFSGLAWGITQAVDYGTVKATVAHHTQTLDRIEGKIDMLRKETVTAPLIGKVAP